MWTVVLRDSIWSLPSASRHYFRRTGSEMMVGISIFGAAEPKALN
jgi:hypothetical protein